MKEPFHLINSLTVDKHNDTIVWMLNIGAEKYWHPTSRGVVDPSEDRIVGRIEEMNLLICRPQDVLILRELPDPNFLKALREWGFAIPTIITPANKDPFTPISELVLKDHRLMHELRRIAAAGSVRFVPYAVTLLEEEIAEACGLIIPHASAQASAAINDKIANRAIAASLGFPVCTGRVCRTVDEIADNYAELTQHPPYFRQVIVKEPYGASGKGLYLISSPKQLASLLPRLSRMARTNPNARWLVEGWHEKSTDVNYQIYISPAGSVSLFSIKRQLLRDTVYVGSKIPVELDDVVERAYAQYGQQIGKYLFEHGYAGVAGIDSIISADGTIVPIIEINGRFTLSTYTSFVADVIGNRKIYSRYLRILSHIPLDFAAVCAGLKGEGILYDPARRTGVIVYVAGTLPIMRDETTGLYPGRLFALIAADDWATAEALVKRLECWADDLTTVSYRFAGGSGR